VTLRLLLRLLAVAALGISAYVHLHLAHRYPYPGTITGTQLFIAQGVTAAAIGLALLVTGNRWAWRAAALVGLISFVAVMTSRYGNVGSIGPLPNMTEHTWLPKPDKPLSAVAEALVPLLWAVEELVSRRRRPVDSAAR
jgi:hypothetical protein